MSKVTSKRQVSIPKEVADRYGIEPGDEIVLSVMEHHANIVPWHFLRERQGVVLKWVEPDVNGDLDPDAVIA